MQYVNNKMVPGLVLALMTIMETHMRVVDLNVFTVRTVQQIRHVLEINVLILVPVYAEYMLFVQLLVTFQLATVYLVI
jgi:hypothetical protein